MAKVENVRPTMTTATYFQIADFLVTKGDNENLKELGRTMRKVYEVGLLEKNQVEYEETNSFGSPENYQNSDECKTGVCD